MTIKRQINFKYAYVNPLIVMVQYSRKKGKGKGHPCTGTEALYRTYGP